MKFYIYENWTADDKAIVHRADCKFCNNGMGTGRGTDGEIHGKWHGSFATSNEALCFAKKLKRLRIDCCKICLK